MTHPLRWLPIALVSTAATLITAPLAHAGDPEAERAFLDEFHRAVPIVPVVTWDDSKSLQLGYTVCRAARDGIDIDHYRSSPWQGGAVDPALRHLCPAATPSR